MVSSRFLFIPAGVLAGMESNLDYVHRTNGSPNSVRTDSTGTPNSVRSTFSGDSFNANFGDVVSSSTENNNAPDLKEEQIVDGHGESGKQIEEDISPYEDSESSFATGYEGSDADDANNTETPRNDDDQTDNKRQVVANNPKKRARKNTWKDIQWNLVEQAAPSPLRLPVRVARAVDKWKRKIMKPVNILVNIMNSDQHILTPTEAVPKVKEPKELIRDSRRLTETAQKILTNSKMESQSSSLKDISRIALTRSVPSTRRVRKVGPKTKTEPSAIAGSGSNTISTNDRKTQSAGFVPSDGLDDNAQDLELEQPDEGSETSFAVGYQGSDVDGEGVWNYRNPVPSTGCVPNELAKCHELAKMALETWKKDEGPTTGDHHVLPPSKATLGEKHLEGLSLGMQRLTLED